MSCSICGRASHNAKNCPHTVKCSLCEKAGHNRRTCPNKNRCSICDRPGHNARACHGREAFDPSPILKDFPLPIGPRLTELNPTCGWFSEEILRSHNQEREEFERTLARLPKYENFRSAFKQLVSTVHRASGFKLYVGRSGNTPQHLLKRFNYHFATKGSFWIQPVFLARTKLMRLRRWEELSIRWTKSKHELGVLCCNNDIPNDCGNWPATDYSVIYVVAGY